MDRSTRCTRQPGATKEPQRKQGHPRCITTESSRRLSSSPRETPRTLVRSCPRNGRSGQASALRRLAVSSLPAPARPRSFPQGPPPAPLQTCGERHSSYPRGSTCTCSRVELGWIGKPMAMPEDPRRNVIHRREANEGARQQQNFDLRVDKGVNVGPSQFS